MPPHPRIPEGQAEAGPMAASRLRTLEDQLIRAKEKITNFQRVSTDGKEKLDAPGQGKEAELQRNEGEGVRGTERLEHMCKPHCIVGNVPFLL